MQKIAVFKKLLLAKKGFTLIELLIVIAVLGVLAAVVLVAIDPAQQLARGRDSGRKTSIGQLGRSLQAYYTSNQDYPAVVQWKTAPNILVTFGEIKLFPSNPAYAAGGAICNNTYKYPDGATVNGFCYRIATVAGTPESVIYARMESKSENSKCPTGEVAWFVWSSADGRAGVVCSAGGEPGPGTQNFLL